MFLNKCKIVIKNNNYKQTLKRLLWNTPSSAEFDLNYLCNKSNIEEIEKNIQNRKGIGDIKLVNILKDKLDSLQKTESNYETLENEFYSELSKIPNKTHPAVTHETEPKVIKTVNIKREFSRKPLEFHEIAKRLKLARTEQLGYLAGSKSYYILGELAELEQALLRYVVDHLLRRNFQLVSVPDIVHRDIIEGCGMNTRGVRTQVYTLDPQHGPDLCLSGTSEIALAGFLMNKTIPENELPLKLAAVSRCYRAESSNITEERGIYRVHEFTKVEMFVVDTPEKSEETLEEIRRIQEENFEKLGLHFMVLDMPPHELGAQAYRKYDLEAWLSGRGVYGEISSCSNCTDYQSRRLAIKFKGKKGVNFAHTLNGTACAIPRLLIALVEGGQNSNGTISVPQVLQKFMCGKSVISKQKKIPDLKLIKNKK